MTYLEYGRTRVSQFAAGFSMSRGVGAGLTEYGGCLHASEEVRGKWSGVKDDDDES